MFAGICYARVVDFWKGVKGSMLITIVLEPSDEGGYTVYVPALPGCISEGDTKEEALANIREAIKLYLEPVEDDLLVDENAAVQEIEV
jgi:predicted RNase H-like HicB family nuclease